MPRTSLDQMNERANGFLIIPRLVADFRAQSWKLIQLVEETADRPEGTNALRAKRLLRFARTFFGPEPAH
jgi:hypothetical protein